MTEADRFRALLADMGAADLRPDDAAVETFRGRLLHLPLVHKLKSGDLGTIRSVLREGLRSAASLGTSVRWAWRQKCGTTDDVFLAMGALTYEPRHGPVLVLRRARESMAAGRGTPWDHGAPRHAASPETAALEVFRRTDLNREWADRYAARLGAACWDSPSEYPWGPPCRTDPPRVLNRTGASPPQPSWVPEARVPRSYPVRGNLVAVVSRREWWQDPDARGLLRAAADEDGARWLETDGDPFTVVRAFLETVWLPALAGD